MAVNPKIQMVEYSQPVGPMRPEKKLTEDGLHICCGAHAMSYYTKKRRSATAPIFSNVTRAIEIPFLNYSNTTSSVQLYTPPETMNFGTIHAADLCTTAQGLLAATKTCWK